MSRNHEYEKRKDKEALKEKVLAIIRTIDYLEKKLYNTEISHYEKVDSYIRVMLERLNVRLILTPYYDIILEGIETKGNNEGRLEECPKCGKKYKPHKLKSPMCLDCIDSYRILRKKD